MRSYGGAVEAGTGGEEAALGETGQFRVAFSRALVFPKELLAPFDATYQESAPSLQLSSEQEAEL